VWHGGSLGTVSGAANLAGLLRVFIGALPDLHAVEQDVVASADLVVLRLVVTATQRGDLLGIPATNRKVRWDAIDVYRVTTKARSAKSGPRTTWRPSRASSARSSSPGASEQRARGLLAETGRR